MTPSKPRATPVRNLTFGLVDTIGREIVTGTYDGRPFPIEAEIEKQHGLSRSVTREALKILTAKGLLSARPRQGTSILPSSCWNLFDSDVLRWLLERKFSYELLRQFTELRLAIEPVGAALAASRATAEELEIISQGFRRMEMAEAGEDDPHDADVAFHSAILYATGNPFFAQFQNVVSTALQTSIRFTNRLSKRHMPDLPAHRLVYDAIRRRRPEAAKVAMESLLSDARALIDKAVKSRSKSPPKI